MSILQEENFHWSLNLAILLIANLLNLSTEYCYIFRNLSMIAHIIEIKKSKLAYILFREFEQSEQGR